MKAIGAKPTNELYNYIDKTVAKNGKLKKMVSVIKEIEKGTEINENIVRNIRNFVKVTEEINKELPDYFKLVFSHSSVADDLGISRYAVDKIVSGRTWKHVKVDNVG